MPVPALLKGTVECINSVLADASHLASNKHAWRVDCAAAGEPGAEWDGVVDRDYIKHRAQKLAKQHDARAKQLSAGGAAPGTRTAAAPAQKA